LLQPTIRWVLQKPKAYGVAGNTRAARGWYEKANELGSADVPRRLELLATTRGEDCVSSPSVIGCVNRSNELPLAPRPCPE
jgi:hypothetical protein